MLCNLLATLVKMKLCGKLLIRKEMWKPVDIIHPHLAVRNFGEWIPLRVHLFRLNCLAFPLVDTINNSLLIPVRLTGKKNRSCPCAADFPSAPRFRFPRQSRAQLPLLGFRHQGAYRHSRSISPHRIRASSYQEAASRLSQTWRV